MAESEEELPEELEDQCEDCHKALAEVERILKPLLSLSRAQTEEKVSVSRWTPIQQYSSRTLAYLIIRW